MKKVLVIFGTRPEAIKLMPLIKSLKESNISYEICLTGQHVEMVDDFLEIFKINPKFRLKQIDKSVSLEQRIPLMMLELDQVFTEYSPNFVFVHGDTASTFAAAQLAFFKRIKIVHVEAGLRSFDIFNPFPEEVNRRFVSMVSYLHFCPTERAKTNLIKEGIDERKIFVTGNTAIDSVLIAVDAIDKDIFLQERLNQSFNYLDPEKKLILVTGHRRESFGDGHRGVCNALRRISRRDDIQVLYPVHLNPAVDVQVRSELDSTPNIFLIRPVDYISFVFLMRRAHIIITDSGGIQEEAPILNKPVLITRAVTERPEVVDCGAGILVGTDADKICFNVDNLLSDEKVYRGMASASNPFGNGQSAKAMVEILDLL